MDSSKIIEAIAEQYGEGNFEKGFRKMFSEKDIKVRNILVNDRLIVVDLSEWEDKVMDNYAIHHSHAWADAIIKLYLK